MAKAQRGPLYRNDQRLLSRCTILILSGWSFGAAMAQMSPPRIQPLCLLVGVCGVLAFVGLEHAARQRKKVAAASNFLETMEKLKQRTPQSPPQGQFWATVAASSATIRAWLGQGTHDVAGQQKPGASAAAACERARHGCRATGSQLR